MPVICNRAARPLYPAIWVFVGYASLVAVVTATNGGGTVEDNLFVGGQLLVLVGFGNFTMTANGLADAQFVPRVSVAFLVGQSLSAATAVLQLLGQSFFGTGAVQGRALGLADHPNTLGLMSCVAILLALHFLTVAGRHRFLVFAALALNLLGLIASGSLSAVMAVVLGAVVLIISKREQMGRIALRGLGLLLAIWLAGAVTGVFGYLPSLIERYEQVTGQTQSDSSWEIRIRTYEFAWERIIQEPLSGNGLGAEWSGTFNGITVTHNLVLRAWYQGGIFLAAAFALVVAVVVIVAVRSMIRQQYGGEACVLVAVMVLALTGAFFEQREHWLPFIVAWASISAAEVRRRREHSAVARSDVAHRGRAGSEAS
ncbi:O-antigen ligase [Mycolicibacterium sp. S2-37]|uniref:O-antigen ligase family protein n=1 Tax=Mycolicibacterium sp. S2-37 TaxID=2810297 RepID=UPI001F5F371E|nr:O-antigen ligase family protein [Mycolicibacterium sp. S2-37]